MNKVICGDCLDVLREMPDNTYSAIVTDPPYALTSTKNGKAGFMGKKWDTGAVAFQPEVWAECLRVAKPGAFLLAFGGSRTFHRLACAIEDAGWILRDTIMFLYGSGMPKIHDISKAIDKAAGADREVIGQSQYAARANKAPRAMNPGGGDRNAIDERSITAPSTEQAKLWDGWANCLKPAFEPILLCQAPLDKNYANNALTHGCGGLWIDGCRINPGESVAGGGNNFNAWRSGENRADRPDIHAQQSDGHSKGRWPANVIISDDPEVTDLFPQTTSGKASKSGHIRKQTLHDTSAGWGMRRSSNAGELYGDAGSAARFFYTAKADGRERHIGMPPGMKNNHATVKPLSLMRYLCRLVKPPGSGHILDPFAGSGTTGVAALLEQWPEITLIDLEPEHCRIAEYRLKHVDPDQFSLDDVKPVESADDRQTDLFADDKQPSLADEAGNYLAMLSIQEEIGIVGDPEERARELMRLGIDINIALGLNPSHISDQQIADERAKLDKYLRENWGVSLSDDAITPENDEA